MARTMLSELIEAIGQLVTLLVRQLVLSKAEHRGCTDEGVCSSARFLMVPHNLGPLGQRSTVHFSRGAAVSPIGSIASRTQTPA